MSSFQKSKKLYFAILRDFLSNKQSATISYHVYVKYSSTYNFGLLHIINTCDYWEKYSYNGCTDPPPMGDRLVLAVGLMSSEVLQIPLFRNLKEKGTTKSPPIWTSEPGLWGC